jgi:Tfp pilus assembly protein PilN
MIRLNLLPPSEKQEIAGQRSFRKIMAWGSSGLIFILTFLAILASIWLYSFIQLRSIQSIAKELEDSPQNQTYKDIKKEIDGINQRLLSFDKLESQRKVYTFYIQKLSEMVNPSIKYTGISIDGNKISLQGLASNRDALLALKSGLEASPYFMNINAPLSNFLKQNNVNFSFSFEIKTQ